MRFLLFMIFIFSALLSNAQYADTSSLNTFIRNTIRDKRPEKVTALQLQNGMLGITNTLSKLNAFNTSLSNNSGHSLIHNNKGLNYTIDSIGRLRYNFPFPGGSSFIEGNTEGLTSNSISVTDGTDSISIKVISGEGIISQTGYTPIIIKNNGNESFRFTSDGKLGVGDPSPTSAISMGNGQAIAWKFNNGANTGGYLVLGGSDNRFNIINASTHFYMLGDVTKPYSGIGRLYGENDPNPSSTFHINGSFANRVRVVFNNNPLTITNDDHILVFEGFSTGSADGVPIYLPDPNTCPGRILEFHEYTASAWAINYGIRRPNAPDITSMTGITVIRAVNGYWRLVSRQ